MMALLENPSLRFRADYSAKALTARRALRVEWVKGCYPTDSLLQEIKGHKQEILCAVNRNVLGLSAPFAQALAALALRNKPKSITQKKWEQILLNLSALLRDNAYWLGQIINRGWGVTDIFGCHSARPQNRIECMGLLLLLDGKQIAQVSKDCITLKTKSAAMLTYRRPSFTPLEQTTLDLLPAEE